jgi:hypothetical protein
MTDNTKIEWTDATWNPIRGCTRVSEGCREEKGQSHQERPMTPQRYLPIVGVALRHPDGRVIALPKPCRHGDLFKVADSLGIDAADWEQGFMHESRGFVDRQSAKLTALICGQMKSETPHAELFSEDVW